MWLVISIHASSLPPMQSHAVTFTTLDPSWQMWHWLTIQYPDIYYSIYTMMRDFTASDIHNENMFKPTLSSYTIVWPNMWYKRRVASKIFMQLPVTFHHSLDASLTPWNQSDLCCRQKASSLWSFGCLVTQTSSEHIANYIQEGIPPQGSWLHPAKSWHHS